ncbi:MAG: pitrilysin family protein [Myxococcota bacterium]
MSDNMQHINSLEGIDAYKLANGLTLLLLPDPSGSQVTVNITYLVGSRHEGRGEAGMAHLLEHMLFKGTPSCPDVKGQLQHRGASFNATTWLDRTNYYETLTANDDNLRFALQLEADRMVNSCIRQEDLDAEMTVVRNEFEMGENNPLGVLQEQLFSASFRWHPYGKSTIGNRSDIERVPAHALRRFYQYHYQPDNAVLMIAGRFEPQTALQMVQQLYGSLPKPQRVLEQTYTEEPAQDGHRRVEVLRVGDVAYVAATYHICAGCHQQFPAVWVLGELLGHEPNGLLYEALVKTQQASEVGCTAYGLAEPGMLFAYARSSQAQQAQQLQQQLTQCLQQRCLQQLTDTAVQQAKARLLKSLKLRMANSQKLALLLTESIAQGDWRLLFWLRDALQQVSLADVQQAASTYLLDNNCTSGLFIPQTERPKRAHVPQTPAPQEVLQHYQGEQQGEQLEAFEPTAANVESHCQHSEPCTGMRLACLPKPTRGRLLQGQLVVRFGSEQQLQGHETPLQLLPDMLLRGTTQLNCEQFQARLDELQSTLTFSGGVGYCSAHIVSDAQHINDVLQLLSEALQQPAWNATEYELLVKRELHDIQEMQTDPQQQAVIRLQQQLHPWPDTSIHHVLSLSQRAQRLQQTTCQQLQQLHEQFYGANTLHCAFVGNVDPEPLHQQLQQQFEQFRSSSNFAPIVCPYRPNEPQSKTIGIPDKEMAFVAMGLSFELQDTHPDYAALRLACYILGEGMTSRLMTQLREKQGFSYGAGSALNVGSLSQHATLMLYAMCAPQNAAPSQHSMQQVYEQWLNKGITQKELQQARVALREAYTNLLNKDVYLARTLAKNLLLQRPFSFYANVLDCMQQLTVEQVNQALQQHLAKARLSCVVAGDLPEAAQTDTAATHANEATA